MKEPLRKRFVKLLPILVPVVILSCAAPSAYNRETGRVAISPPPSNLVKQGNLAFAKYKATKKVSSNSSYKAKVNRVATRITRKVPLPGAQWEFVVFDDPTPNAFALPGGKVGVNTGLLRLASTDAELATVISHEIAHVTSNHAMKRIQRQQLIGIGAMIVGNAVGGPGAGDAAKMTQMGGQLLLGLPFSRSQEMDADKVGTIFMARAGYNPQSALSLWKKMAAYKAKKGQKVPEFLSTHPVDSTRLAELNNFMSYAMREYQR